jgi:hypothetical protein
MMNVSKLSDSSFLPFDTSLLPLTVPRELGLERMQQSAVNQPLVPPTAHNGSLSQRSLPRVEIVKRS